MRSRHRGPTGLRSRWRRHGSVLGMLTVVAGFGLMTYATAAPAAATRFSPDEQRILEELPDGFGADTCETARNLPAGSLAGLKCGQNAGLSGPAGGRFVLFADPDALNRAFQDDLAGRGPDYQSVPCPGTSESPNPWHFTSTPWEVAGQMFCGTYKGAPDIEWTRDRELLLLNVHDGPDLNSLSEWWDRYGNEPREPFPYPEYPRDRGGISYRE